MSSKNYRFYDVVTGEEFYVNGVNTYADAVTVAKDNGFDDSLLEFIGIDDDVIAEINGFDTY